jgi:hypothetical protein
VLHSHRLVQGRHKAAWAWRDGAVLVSTNPANTHFSDGTYRTCEKYQLQRQEHGELAAEQE